MRDCLDSHGRKEATERDCYRKPAGSDRRWRWRSTRRIWRLPERKCWRMDGMDCVSMVGRSSLASVPFSTLQTSNSLISLSPSLYMCIGFDLSHFGSIFLLFSKADCLPRINKLLHLWNVVVWVVNLGYCPRELCASIFVFEREIEEVRLSKSKKIASKRHGWCIFADYFFFPFDLPLYYFQLSAWYHQRRQTYTPFSWNQQLMFTIVVSSENLEATLSIVG